MIRFTTTGMTLLLSAILLTRATLGVEHRVEEAADPLPKDQLSPEIVARLDEKGIQLVRGAKTTVCQIWLCKEWNTISGFKPTSEVLYPFKPGELIGVIKYPRKAGDFRDQDIASGVYTMRYAQQPVDGAHVGTSPTRDFLLLIEAAKDTQPVGLETKDLNKRSAETAGSSHPALLALQRPAGDEAPIRHNEEHDWWIIRVNGTAHDGTQKAKLPVDLLVVGKSPE